MGILTDAFIATDVELATTQFEGSGGPIAFFPTLQGKGIDPIMLAMLEAIVMERVFPSPDTLAEVIDQRIIRGKDESSEEWIYQFPDKMVTRLAELTAAEGSRYGTVWASTEEMCGPKGVPQTTGVTQYLRELCQLAIRAQDEGKHLYMWISL
jgi:hypothetical protein